MLKIGEHELTKKDLIAAAVFVLVAITLVWVMVGSKPKPTVLLPGAGDPVLLQGGIPGAQAGCPPGAASARHPIATVNV